MRSQLLDHVAYRQGEAGPSQPLRQAATSQASSTLLRRPALNLRRVEARRWAGTAAYPTAASASSRTSPGVVGIATSSRRPIGGMRGAITGFAMGLGLASAYGLTYVVKEYQASSVAMAAAVQELEESTSKVTAAFARVSALEDRLVKLENTSSTTSEVRQRYGDLVRVYDALHEDVFEVKHKLYDIEQDLNRSFGTPLSRSANGRLV